jgi:hypothetical protein
MPPRSAQGESKQGLIITLVFFILMTLILGILTYLGYDGQTAKEAAAKEAENKRKLMEEDRDWYKFQALYYRSVMGHPDAANVEFLTTRKEQFDTDRLKAGTDKEDVRKLIKENLEKQFGWSGNKPNKTYDSELTKLRADYDNLAKRNDGLQAALNKANKDLETAKKELEQAQTTFAGDLKKFENKNTEEQKTDRDTIAKLREEIEKLGKDIKDATEKSERDKKALDAQLAKKNTEINQLKAVLKTRDEEISQFKLKGTDAPPNMRTDWKIVSMDRRGQNPYINLGSADKVQPQQTFTIHGIDASGRPIPKAKGTLEVINVIRDHLSQAHITSVKDPDRDPIMQGDVLYNPSWNPTIKKHVALAGIIDLTGDGRDSLPEFKHNLERQNIVVDAWLDPKDFSIKGKGITVQTDYLIIGSSAEFQSAGRAARSGDAEKKLNEGIQRMKDQAARNGVEVKSLNKYLEMIGYRLPRSTGEERQPSLYDPRRRPDQAPRVGDKPIPRMESDK